MFPRLKTILTRLGEAGQDSADAQDDLKRAAVVLLVEVMMADHHIDVAEKKQLIKSTMALWQISREESAELIEQASQQHAELVSLYDVTRIINLQFDQDRKIDLVTQMWCIAYADEQWDKYEEHLIRKVADLLYISHKDFIRARHQAQAQLSGSP